MSASEILDLCQNNGIFVFNDDTKADMIAAIREKQTLPNAADYWWLNYEY